MTMAPAEMRGSKTPWSYFFVRLLFKFVLKTFYGTIVIENDHLVPESGIPCIVCANHSNSLTDALVLVTSVPSKRRGMLRLTAKSTQFGHPTFTSWLIESAGTVPIKRRRDYKEGENVDNSDTMGKLMEALELGDAVCLFPEGASRYHPTMQPLKTGVARILSDVLTRNKDNPSFQIALQTCSVTYMHPQHFRSDVLVTFHPPMIFTPKDNPELIAPVDFNNVKALTFRMQEVISSGTTDAPSWDLVRCAKLAARMYAPLGTEMSLGDYVRVVRTFLQAFKAAQPSEDSASAFSEDESQAPLPVSSAVARVEICRELKVGLLFLPQNSPLTCGFCQVIPRPASETRD
jgi:glycerol-3-phosphate O-acyltransferase/dihydroxyacetone phosphate acyltransferase